jgi:hypothetical protein
MCPARRFHSTWSSHVLACVQATLISAAILGVSMAEVGVSIQHDANHGAFSTNTWLGALLVRIMQHWTVLELAGQQRQTDVAMQQRPLTVGHSCET